MQDSKHLEVLPLASAAEGAINIDQESAAAAESRELRRKQCIQWIVFVAVFIVSSALTTVTLNTTIMRYRTPKLKLQSITINSLNTSNATASQASFDMELSTQLTIRNRNFGPFAYQFGYLTFSYEGSRVGDAVIHSSSAGARSTKVVVIMVNISSGAVPRRSNLGSDIASGRLALTSDSTLRGQVEIMKVFTRARTAIMDCTLTISLSRQVVEEFKCDD